MAIVESPVRMAGQAPGDLQVKEPNMCKGKHTSVHMLSQAQLRFNYTLLRPQVHQRFVVWSLLNSCSNNDTFGILLGDRSAYSVSFSMRLSTVADRGSTGPGGTSGKTSGMIKLYLVHTSRKGPLILAQSL